ncbi:hypothetical protein EJ03DRAFT_54357 [Teratosphaeria nubilosa]|uniref:Uncharacterized protein n=1 Tax=Teratosphaeria nubilosa TaxID=161662 RepID=A0A6G1KUI4_9PEZI|nr:hypothetical protein EJ03DRAFT_54357 [Teratosphaeria nubilosa]
MDQMCKMCKIHICTQIRSPCCLMKTWKATTTRKRTRRPVNPQNMKTKTKLNSITLPMVMLTQTSYPEKARNFLATMMKTTCRETTTIISIMATAEMLALSVTRCSLVERVTSSMVKATRKLGMKTSMRTACKAFIFGTSLRLKMKLCKVLGRRKLTLSSLIVIEPPIQAYLDVVGVSISKCLG